MDPLNVMAYGQEKAAEFRGERARSEGWTLFAKPQKSHKSSLSMLVSRIKRFIENPYRSRERHVRS